MPKHHKKKATSCSSDSDDSGSENWDVCCVFPDFENACDLFKHYERSVVSVATQTILSTLAAGTQPTGTPTDTAVVRTVQDGFFFGGGKKNQFLILTPAQGIIVNPTLLASYNRYPASPGAVGVPTGLFPNTVTRASQILVTVNGAREKHGIRHSYVYEANLIGVDATANWAILHINKPTPAYNEDSPHTKCLDGIPYFCPADPNAVCDGQKIFALGDFISRPTPLTLAGGGVGIAAGHVLKHRTADPDGKFLSELITLSLPGVYHPKAGGPVVMKNGMYIGMLIADTVGAVPAGAPTAQLGDGFVAAISNRSMLSNQKKILKSTRQGCCGNDNAVSAVADALGGFNYVQHNWLGIAYRLVEALTFSETIVNLAAAPFIRFDPRLLAVVPLAPGALPVDPACKRIVGMQVLAIAGASLPAGAVGATGLFVPGGTIGGAPQLGFAAPLGNSPLLGEIAVGDIITSINNVPIGNLLDQATPSLPVWNCSPTCVVNTCNTSVYTLDVRTVATTWANVVQVKVESAVRPPFMEYPWANAYKQLPITLPVAVTSPIIPDANFYNAL